MDMTPQKISALMESVKGRAELMALHERFEMPLSATTDNGELSTLSINKDNITVSTFQKNNWVRINVYHADGMIEELYEK